ncbi:MAG: hypothetical protein V1845_01255 [bacterium]
MKKSSQSGFSAIVLAVIIVLAVVGGGLLAWKQGWIPEFFVATETPTPTPASDETADWKTYTNNDYGFEFKYPQIFFLDSQLVDLGDGSYGFDSQTKQLNSDVSPGATHLYVNFAKFSSLIDNKETCTNGVCSRKSPMEDQRIINQSSVGDEIETSSGLPGKVVSIGDAKGFRYLGYNPQAKAYNAGIVVFNSQVDRIELSMSITAPDETQAENDKLNKGFDQIISTFKFTK